MPASERSALLGSDRSPLPGARKIGASDANETVLVTVVTRRRPSSKSPEGLLEANTLMPSERHYYTREEFAAVHGADPADLARIEEFAHEHGLTVVESSAARRSVILSGTVEAMQSAFSVQLATYDSPKGKYRGRTGAITLPSEIADVVQAVLGLDNRPAAKPHFIRRKDTPTATAQAGATALTPIQVARLYGFPTNVTGQGQTIAIIELGGGYRTADLKAYFTALGLKTPKVTAVSVDGGHNQPGQDADGEVMLDIEVAGAVAPGAKIAVYFAPNTDQGFHDAITQAVHDTVRKPSAISISWGAPETGPANESWTLQAITSMSSALQDAAAMGVTVTVASGDNGSTDGVSDKKSHVDFPSSCPFSLACGGTRLIGSGAQITSETVWNDGPDSATGGGVSGVFQKPAYQASVNVPPSTNPSLPSGRGVPDIAGNADPQSGYICRVNGQQEVIGGTSAVAPLWAGLVALLNQSLGKSVGFLNPVLYSTAQPANALHDITSGNNGVYKAASGWDPCTGLGTPNGSALVQALGGSASQNASAVGIS